MVDGAEDATSDASAASATDTDDSARAVFFYGTFMHERVLRAHGIDHGPTRPARLRGYRLTIRPRANVVEDDSQVTYGAVATMTSRELGRLYDSLRNDFGVDYEPEAVQVELRDGEMCEVQCYMSSSIGDDDPDPEYIVELIRCASELGAPREHLDTIASFGNAPVVEITDGGHDLGFG